MRAGRLLVLLACLVGSLSYAGAVTASALVTLVLPEVLIVGLVAQLAARRPLAGLVAVVLFAGGVGEVVKILSGDYQGSVARSASGAGLLTGIAVLLAGTRRPASFLVPLVGVIAWALALGSGGRVALLAVLTAALGAAALATLEGETRRYVTPAPRTATLAMVLLLTIGAGAAAAMIQVRVNPREPADPFRSSQTVTVQPPAFLALTARPPRSATAPPVASHDVPSPSEQVRQQAALSHHVALIAITVFALVLAALALALMVRWFWVTVSWGLLHRRLKRRAPSQEAGAWSWVLATAQRLGDPLPLNASPDVILDQAPSEAMRALAEQVTRVAFGPEGGASRGDVWVHADAVSHERWAAAARSSQLRAHFRRPSRAARAH